MNLLNPETRLENFKNKINLKEVLSKEPTGSLIQSVVIEPDKYSQLEGWTSEKKTSSFRGEELFQEWIFKKNNEALLIEVYLSPKTVEGTRKRFLETVDSTSTMEIPFKNSPEPIGTLSVVPLQQPYDYVIFIYKNTYVHVRSYHSSIDVLTVSKNIYEQLIKK